MSSVPGGLAEVAFAAFVALTVVVSHPRNANDNAGFVVELLLCAACALVGRWPVPATIAACALAASLLALAPEHSRPSLLAMLIPITAAGAAGLHMLRVGVSVLFLVVTATIENNPPLPALQLAGRMVGWTGLVVVGWSLGEVLHRLSTQRTDAHQARADAVRAQRRSIARDLHDTVAYSTTSIILRAEQIKLRGVDDPQLAADLDYIIAAGRSSMRDLRGMMETLRRNDPAPAQGAPHSPWLISSLEEVLVERIAELRSHGFTATQHVDDDLTPLPESVRETLAKIVVEATSNMVKHGDTRGPCSIMIEISDEDVAAVFINKPKPRQSGSRRRRTGAHLGLIGARERVEALGGEVLVTSESPTWVVQARIPLGRGR